MASLTVNVRAKTKLGKKILVEFDADKFERLAADFGFFGPDFIQSIERAEKDYRAGRVKKIRSLKSLRTKGYA